MLMMDQETAQDFLVMFWIPEGSKPYKKVSGYDW